MLTIATHNGIIHADEIFAVAVLKLVFKDIKIVRTRDDSIINSADVRVDIGRKYDPKTFDFDHHQEETVKRENGIPYAAFGLIWKEYGLKVCNSKFVFEYIDKKLVQSLDANDNGIDVTTSIYKDVKPYTIYGFIKALNPIPGEKDSDFDKAFLNILKIAVKLLKREIKVAKSIEKSNKTIRKLIKEAEKENKQYIVLKEYSEYEDIVISESNIKLVVYPSVTGQYYVKSVRTEKGSFENRFSFPESWAGKEKEELAKVTGITDSLFCHKGRFLYTAKTLNSALKVAEMLTSN